jgi:hypothetical protein
MPPLSLWLILFTIPFFYPSQRGVPRRHITCEYVSPVSQLHGSWTPSGTSCIAHEPHFLLHQLEAIRALPLVPESANGPINTSAEFRGDDRGRYSHVRNTRINSYLIFSHSRVNDNSTLQLWQRMDGPIDVPIPFPVFWSHRSQHSCLVKTLLSSLILLLTHQGDLLFVDDMRIRYDRRTTHCTDSIASAFRPLTVTK